MWIRQAFAKLDNNANNPYEEQNQYSIDRITQRINIEQEQPARTPKWIAQKVCAHAAEAAVATATTGYNK